VTSTMPPAGPGSRRSIPDRLDAEQRARLEELLRDPDTWVLRSSWEEFLRSGASGTLVRTDELTRDQRVAARAWLHQQRHRLYATLEGGIRAPDGWLEQLPLLQRLEELL
jgi:hypothetical protein